MGRKYESRRRIESAERTRSAIVEAAVKLHGQGITQLAAIAEEAGVSLPTVSKHFPTREDLFVACTRHVAENLDYPSPEALAAIPDPTERAAQIVRQVYALHESTFGQVWTGYRLEDESAALARAIAEQERFVGLMAGALFQGGGTGSPAYGFAVALLSPLTYRALRLKGCLSFEQAVEQTTRALVSLLPAG
jgi:AcrR family transcriptional regulator